MKWLALVAVATCALQGAGCALTRKSAPVDVHYYSPAITADVQTTAQGPPRARVRLGRITTGSHLRYAIARRTSAVQLQLYELDRWTDTPDVYVKRSLEHALFEAKPIEQATSGGGIFLDVDVLAFEEVGSPPAGRVQLRYRLRDNESVLAADTVTIVRPSRSARLADVVVAIGSALDAATAQIAERVLVALERR